MSPPLPGGGSLWLGYFMNAAFRHGPLKVLPQPGELCFGSPEVFPPVRVRPGCLTVA